MAIAEGRFMYIFPIIRIGLLRSLSHPRYPLKRSREVWPKYLLQRDTP